AGLVLLIVPLAVSEVGQLQVQLPGLAASAQDRLNGLQPIRVFGIDVDLKGVTETVSSHLREYLLGQFGNAVTLGLTALTTVLQLLLMFIVAFLLALEAPAVRRDLRRFVPNDYRTDFDQIWRKVRKMLYAYVLGQLVIAGLIWGGMLGMFVAVPIAATLRILFDHIYPRLYERPA